MIKILRESKNIVAGRVKIPDYCGDIICSFTDLKYLSHNFYEKFRKYIPCIYESYPSSKLNSYSKFSKFNKDAPIWVHPKARISRDILRNSGYKITLNKENAGGIIIPELTEDNMRRINVNIIAFDNATKTTYMFCLVKKPNTRITNEHVERTKDAILTKIGAEKSDVDFHIDECGKFERFQVCLLPKVEEWFDLLENKDGIYEFRPENIYKIDRDVQVTPAFEINVETLEMVRRMDSIFLEKFLISCPFKEYPVTLFYFLNNEFAHDKFSNNNNLKMVLREIWYYSAKLDNAIEVTPKDLNMLQDWIFHLMGLDGEDKAFIPVEKYSKLKESYKAIIRRRFAVSKISIDEPVSFGEIMDLAKD